YINDFLYFVIRPDKDRGDDMLLFCSGVNITRFSPVTTGRHGIGSNPALRGLQLVNHGVRDLALSRGAIPKRVRGNDCAGIAPTRDDWYTEIMLIENAPGSFPEVVIHYGVIHLLMKIFKACLLEFQPPDPLPAPGELQKLIEDLCRKYGNW
ncbi:MAG TPA: hypothetical protein VEE82_02595, partial [Thermodesulfovibrionales bacterium]|nr:hypothetical protein [Thermodesulfovibrionales bacterium]